MAVSFDVFYSRARKAYPGLPDEYIASEYKRVSGNDAVLTDPQFKDSPLGNPGIFTDIKRGLKFGLGQVEEQVGAGRTLAQDWLGKTATGVLSHLPGPFGLVPGIASEFSTPEEQVGLGRARQARNTAAAGINVDISTPEGGAQALEHPVKYGASQLSQMIPGMLPAVAAGAAGGGMLGFGAMAGLQEALPDYLKMRESGMGKGEATARTAAEVAAIGSLNVLPGAAILGKLPGGRSVLGRMLAGGITEPFTEYLEEPASAIAQSPTRAEIPGRVRESLKSGLNVIPGAALAGILFGGFGGSRQTQANPDLERKINLYMKATGKSREEAIAEMQDAARGGQGGDGGDGGGGSFGQSDLEQIGNQPRLEDIDRWRKDQREQQPGLAIQTDPPTLTDIERLGKPPAGVAVGEDVKPYNWRQDAKLGIDLGHLGLPLPPGPTWFSTLERTVDAAQAPKATGEQWANYLKNKGAKSEELKWTGAEDWLREQKGAVTKQALAEYVREHKVDVQEVTLQSKSPYNYQGNEWQQAINAAEQRGDHAEAERINRAWEGLDEETGSTAGQPKFSQYQLPGGENYRELLLTLPVKRLTQPYSYTAKEVGGSSNPLESWRIQNDQSGEYIGPRMDRTGAEMEARTRTASMRQSSQLPLAPGETPFTSSHFNTPNVLAHVRFNDRTDANGKKTLFIEEVQSDWHQKGRKQGYGGAPFKVGVREDANVWVVTRSDGKFGDVSKRDATTAAEAQAYADAHQEIYRHNAPPTGAVPDAPFKSTWPDLAMKRMIRWAAEHGYDQVAWTPGEVQADRYDLSKQVDKVIIKRWKDGGYSVSAEKRGDQKLLQIDLKKEQLPEYVGKELADKFLNSEDHQNAILGQGETVKTYSGLDLKVGGEGMKGFYDKILVDTANKLGKRFGARVGKATLEGGIERIGGGTIGRPIGPKMIETHSLPITQAMRESVMQGQAVMAPQKAYNATHAYAQQGQQDLQFETRPGTTPAQVEKGNAFLGSLIAFGDRVAGARVLANGLTADFRERGFTPLIGQSARSPSALALLAQTYRDPRVETLHVFALKGDQIVGQTALAQRLPGAVNFGPQHIEDWAAFLAAYDADGYYLLHNHPAGNATPSREDIGMTTKTRRELYQFKFRGHVIIDHNQYGLIPPSSAGSGAGHVVKRNFKGYDPNVNPRLAHPWLGQHVNTTEELVKAGFALVANPGEITIITTDSSNRVRAITSFPENKIASYGGGGINDTKIKARIKRVRAASGSSGKVFAVTENPNALQIAWRHGLFTDVVHPMTGETYFGKWQAKHGSAEVARDRFQTNTGRTTVREMSGVAEQAPQYQPENQSQIPPKVEVGGGEYSTAELADISPQVAQVMVTGMSALEKQVADQRGGAGPRTWSEVEAGKNRRVYQQAYHDLINRRLGGIAGDKMMDAFGDLVVSAGHELKAAIEEVNRTGSAQAVARAAAAREKYGLLAAPYAGYKTELGRGLAIIRKAKHQMQQADQIFEALGDGTEQAIKDFARSAQGKNLTELLDQTAASYQPTVQDQFREYWINSILSGPWTHAVNIASNNLFVALESVAELATSLVSKDVSFKAALARLTGMLTGMRLGAVNFGKAIKTGDPQLNQHMQIEQERRNAIPGKIGHIIRFPGRALTAADEFSKAVAFTGQLHYLAMEEAQKRNPENPHAVFEEVLRSYANNDAVQAIARQHADRMTFQKDLGPIGKSMMSLRNKLGPLGWLLVPFVRTPTNIIKEFAKFTLAGFAMPSVISDLNIPGAPRARAYGRMLIGTSVMASVVGLVLEGLMTGNGPPDKTKRDAWLLTGRRPYSWKVGDQWIKYNRLEPVGMLLGMAADMTEMSRAGLLTDQQGEKLMTMALASFMTNLADKTFLRGIVDFTQAATDPGRYMASWAASMAGSMIPNISAQIARGTDPYVRDARTFLDSLQARIPGAREDLPAKLDLSGQPIESSTVEPFASAQTKDDPLAETMLQLDAAHGLPSRDITLQKHRYNLTGEEYESYAGFMQQARWNVMTPVVSSPGFKQLAANDSLQAKYAFERLWSKVGKQAHDVWLLKHPEVIRKIAQQAIVQNSSTYLQ